MPFKDFVVNLLFVWLIIEPDEKWKLLDHEKKMGKAGKAEKASFSTK